MYNFLLRLYNPYRIMKWKISSTMVIPKDTRNSRGSDKTGLDKTREASLSCFRLEKKECKHKGQQQKIKQEEPVKNRFLFTCNGFIGIMRAH